MSGVEWRPVVGLEGHYQECDACFQWLSECVCPTLPLDEEDQ